MNKRKSLGIVLNLLISCAVAFAASPQPAKSGFPAFWLQFKSAVARQDAEAVAGMTKLPFDLYGKPLDHAAFVKQYRKLFGGLRACIAKAKPVRDGETYSVFCGEQGLLFQKTEGGYKFVEFFAND